MVFKQIILYYKKRAHFKHRKLRTKIIGNKVIQTIIKNQLFICWIMKELKLLSIDAEMFYQHALKSRFSLFTEIQRNIIINLNELTQ